MSLEKEFTNKEFGIHKKQWLVNIAKIARIKGNHSRRHTKQK